MSNSYLVYTLIVVTAVLVAVFGSILIWGADQRRSDRLAIDPDRSPNPRP